MYLKILFLFSRILIFFETDFIFDNKYYNSIKCNESIKNRSNFQNRINNIFFNDSVDFFNILF